MTQNRMQHVRDHIVAMMEALKDPNVEPDVIERAKAVSTLAQTYTNTVKVELEARKLAGKENELPDVLQPAPLPPPRRPVIEGGAR